MVFKRSRPPEFCRKHKDEMLDYMEGCIQCLEDERISKGIAEENDREEKIRQTIEMLNEPEVLTFLKEQLCK